MHSQVALANAFSTHDFAAVYKHLSKDIIWDNVGDQKIIGKSAVIAACDEALKYFLTITTDLKEMHAYEGVNHVTITTLTTYSGKESASMVSSCDIYTFSDGNIKTIVSYNVDCSNI